MESIINNPDLQHLAERIFLNLDTEHLKICRLINQSCKQILENPFFWLKKFRNPSKENQKDWIKILKEVENNPCFWLKKFKNLSKENQKDWIKILKQVKNSEKIHDIISYLEFIHILYLDDV